MSVSALRLASLAISLAVWSTTSAVYAVSPEDDAAGVDSPQRSEARDWFARGVTLMDERRFAEALEAFQQAYALWENPKILLNVATALLALDRPAEAATRYVAYLDSGAATPERAVEINEILGRIRPRVARLVVNPSGGLQRVELDGAPAELQGERPHWLTPGRHVLALVYADGERFTHTFEVQAGVLTTLDGATLYPKPAASAQATPQRERDRASREASVKPSWALTFRADIDGAGRGGVGAAGLIAPLTRSVRLSAGALAGSRGGAWLGVDAAAKLGAFRPSLGASLPMFFSDATVYPGLAAELGLRYETAWIASPFVRVAVVHFLRVPTGYISTVAVPSVGIEVPL